MVNKIQLRRGTNAEREAVILDSGEPGWTTDTKDLYVGDGETLGGNLVTGVKAATFVVAASDSLHKERADYVCDGVDDQVEIQAALDSMIAGGKLYLEAGNYSITGTINMPDISGITIEGAGIGHVGKGALLTLAHNSNCSMFKLDHSTHVYFTKFVGFGMMGNSSHQSQTSHGFDVVKHTSDFYFEDLIAFGFHDDCIHIQTTDGCWNIWINQCLLEGSLGKAIFIDDANWIHINDCYLYSNYTGISIHSADNVSMSGVQFASQYEHGIVVSDSSSVFINSCNLLGDYSATNSYDVIHIKNASAVVLIKGNIINGANKARACVYIEDGCYRIIVTGNEIDCWSPTVYVIDESTAGTVKIRDNLGYITKNTGTSTGTGAQQSIAHGLKKTPTKVILWNIEDGANPYQSAAADGTNIKITAVINQDYGWEAEAV